MISRPRYDQTLARIERDGHVVGAGFLVSERHLLTCSHVVGKAGDTLELTFLANPGRGKVAARVEAATDKDTEDVAVVVFDGPVEGTSPAPLGRWSLGATFRATGFPRGRTDGDSVEGRLQGVDLNHQVQLETTGARRIVRRFSGTGVWSGDAVVGMVVAYYEEDPSAYMIPVERIAEILMEPCAEVSQVIRRTLGGAAAEPLAVPPPASDLSYTYDVFLCYNSADRSAVEPMARRLRQEGLRVFYDQWEMIPGRPWQEQLETALEASRTCAVIVGGGPLGPWQTEEMRVAVDTAVHEHRSVIPVLMSGASERGLPAFLRRLGYVDFRSDDGDALRRLVRGIRGSAPGISPAGGSSSVPGGDIPETNRQAVATWQERLEFLLEQQALAVAADQKFALKKQIEEARHKIEELSKP